MLFDVCVCVCSCLHVCVCVHVCVCFNYSISWIGIFTDVLLCSLFFFSVCIYEFHTLKKSYKALKQFELLKVLYNFSIIILLIVFNYELCKPQIQGGGDQQQQQPKTHKF